MLDHRGQLPTGFVPTPHIIGLGCEPNPTASRTRSCSITVKRIRAWVEQKQLLGFKFPDMEQVMCVFTGKPIGEENPFCFIRCKKGGRNDIRIVMCLTSCNLDEDRYEVLPIENGGIGTFKVAIGNMANSATIINRSLYY